MGEAGSVGDWGAPMDAASAGDDGPEEEGEEERQGRLPFGTAYHLPVVCKEVTENYIQWQGVLAGTPPPGETAPSSRQLTSPKPPTPSHPNMLIAIEECFKREKYPECICPGRPLAVVLLRVKPRSSKPW